MLTDEKRREINSTIALRQSEARNIEKYLVELAWAGDDTQSFARTRANNVCGFAVSYTNDVLKVTHNESGTVVFYRIYDNIHTFRPGPWVGVLTGELQRIKDEKERRAKEGADKSLVANLEENFSEVEL